MYEADEILRLMSLIDNIYVAKMSILLCRDGQ